MRNPGEPFGYNMLGQPCGCIHAAYKLFRENQGKGRIINITWQDESGGSHVQNYYIPSQAEGEPEEVYLDRFAQNTDGYTAPAYTIGQVLQLLQTDRAREINPWEYKGL